MLSPSDANDFHMGDLIDHALVEYVWVLQEAKYLWVWYEPTTIDFR